FFACLLSLILGALFFEILGYYPIVYVVFILLFVPILVRMQIQAGFVTSMVIVTHVYMVKSASLDMFLNELYIIFIGMGIAFFINSFMPNLQEDINTCKQKIEQKFEVIILEFSYYIMYISCALYGH